MLDFNVTTMKCSGMPSSSLHCQRILSEPRVSKGTNACFLSQVVVLGGWGVGGGDMADHSVKLEAGSLLLWPQDVVFLDQSWSRRRLEY